MPAHRVPTRSHCQCFGLIRVTVGWLVVPGAKPRAIYHLYRALVWRIASLVGAIVYRTLGTLETLGWWIASLVGAIVYRTLGTLGWWFARVVVVCGQVSSCTYSDKVARVHVVAAHRAPSWL